MADTSVRAAVSFTLKNTGTYDGKEVVQLYVGQKNAPVSRPAYELKAFQKVYVKVGKSIQVTLNLTANSFAYYDTETGYYTAKKGTYQIYIGSSSTDIRLQTEITLTKDYNRLSSSI